MPRRVIQAVRRAGGALGAAGLLAASLTSCGIFGTAVHDYFYLSPSGSDSAAGTSPGAAWRTLDRANAAKLRPGDHLLLQGGKRFAGTLRLGPQDAGRPAKPVVIGSYGTGRATIAGTGGPGVVVYDAGGIEIRNLNVAGQSPARAGADGIKLYSDLPADHRLWHIVIDHVNVSGFMNGISLGAAHPAGGFAGVWITNSALHDNIAAGLAAYGPAYNAAAPSFAHANLTISKVTAYRNRGNPADTRSNSGNGIVLGSVRNAVVDRSTAYDNGGAGGARHEGPIGIWAYDSTGVLIEHCLSYGNRTANRRDGGGFGLDQNTTASVLQYNLSYGNDGGGFQVYAPSNAISDGNVVRYNITSGDARLTINAAGIIVAGNVTNASIYQNTVVMAPEPGMPHAALWAGQVSGVTVRNNIFMVEHPGPVIVAQHNLRPQDALFQGNDYVTTRPPWSVLWGLDISYPSLAAWRAATGQERVGGNATGLAVDPDFAGPVRGLSAASATESNAGAGFLLRPGSPLIGAGLDLTRFGTDPGKVTFAGRPVPSARPNIGAQ